MDNSLAAHLGAGPASKSAEGRRARENGGGDCCATAGVVALVDDGSRGVVPDAVGEGCRLLLRGGWAAGLGGALREAIPYPSQRERGDCRATAAWFGSVDAGSYGVVSAQSASGVACYSGVAGPLHWGLSVKPIP